jgi:hypothetical protein
VIHIFGRFHPAKTAITLQLENVDGRGQSESLLGHSGFNHMVEQLSTPLSWIGADSALELPIDRTSMVIAKPDAIQTILTAVVADPQSTTNTFMPSTGVLSALTGRTREREEITFGIVLVGVSAVISPRIVG